MMTYENYPEELYIEDIKYELVKVYENYARYRYKTNKYGYITECFHRSDIGLMPHISVIEARRNMMRAWSLESEVENEKRI